MLTRSELASLSKRLRDEFVLSVYLDGRSDDPATRHTWHVALENALRPLRLTAHDAPKEEREAFDACVARLREHLVSVRDAESAPGWCAFVSADTVHHAGALPIGVRTAATWGRGIAVVPYLPAFEEQRPVLLVVVDARHARLHHYQEGTVRLLRTVVAPVVAGESTHMGNVPARGFHPGVRGATGRDAARRALETGTERMLREVVRHLEVRSADRPWIVTGGIPSVAAQLRSSLPAALAARAREAVSLDVHATDHGLAALARRSASEMRLAEDRRRLATLVGSAKRGGRAAVGPADVLAALEEGRVRELYVMHGWGASHPAEAERLVRAAFDAGATVEDVGDPGTDLPGANEGVVARLHSPVRRTPRAAPRPSPGRPRRQAAGH